MTIGLQGDGKERVAKENGANRNERNEKTAGVSEGKKGRGEVNTEEARKEVEE